MSSNSCFGDLHGRTCHLTLKVSKKNVSANSAPSNEYALVELTSSAEGICSPEDIAADDEFCQMLASVKYLRVNFTPYSAHEALYETLCVVLSTQ